MRGGVGTRTDLLTKPQRGLLVGACAALSATAVIPATYNFILTPMLHDFDATETQESVLRQLPSIATLLVVFVAGIVGQRVGERRFIQACMFAFIAGCLVVAGSPALAVAAVGLVVASAATSSMIVVSIALISANIAGRAQRASAFSVVAIVAPVIYMFFPVVAGYLLDNASWRTVAVLWSVVGCGLLIVANRTLPAAAKNSESSELFTPAFAGLVLAAAIQTITAGSYAGWTSREVVMRALATAIFVVAFIVAYQRVQRPTVSLAVLKGAGLRLLLVVVIVVPFANLWFYMTIGYQYIFGLSATQTALVFIPSQAAGVLGAVISRSMIQRRGLTFAGTLMLAALSGSLLLSIAITTASPMWFLMAVMSAYAFASVGAAVPVTNAVMNSAEVGDDSQVASFRSAAMNLGNALGVVVMTAIVFGVTAASLTHVLADDNLVSPQSAQIAEELRDGATSEEVGSEYAVPQSDVSSIDAAQQEAMIEGLHAHGLVGAVVILVATCLYWTARRRQRIRDGRHQPKAVN